MSAPGPRPGAEETERVRYLYDKMAPRYDRAIAVAERVLYGDARQRACSQAAGRVLEVAIGTGRNLPFYPPPVHVTGVDISPDMLAKAQARAAPCPRRSTGRSVTPSSFPTQHGQGDEDAEQPDCDGRPHPDQEVCSPATAALQPRDPSAAAAH